MIRPLEPTQRRSHNLCQECWVSERGLTGMPARIATALYLLDLATKAIARGGAEEQPALLAE
jgi:hypothetical protein